MPQAKGKASKTPKVWAFAQIHQGLLLRFDDQHVPGIVPEAAFSEHSRLLTDLMNDSGHIQRPGWLIADNWRATTGGLSSESRISSSCFPLMQ